MFGVRIKNNATLMLRLKIVEQEFYESLVAWKSLELCEVCSQ